MKKPQLELTDRKITHKGNSVGCYALNHTNGEIVAVRWTTLFRRYNSYAISSSLLEDIECSKIFTIDKSDDSVYLFTKDDYWRGEMTKNDRGFQNILERTEYRGKWDSLDEILKG